MDTRNKELTLSNLNLKMHCLQENFFFQCRIDVEKCQPIASKLQDESLRSTTTILSKLVGKIRSVFFSLKLYTQYFCQKWMKFKFWKKDFKAWNVYFQKLIIFFWVYVSNFYIQKIMSWKRWKIFFSLCWFVTCSNLIWKNFWLSVVKAWSFP